MALNISLEAGIPTSFHEIAVSSVDWNLGLDFDVASNCMLILSMI
jgi:hypothetical protein